MRRYLPGSIWGVCDRCGADTWVRVWERDYLDEPVSYICAVGCDDTANRETP